MEILVYLFVGLMLGLVAVRLPHPSIDHDNSALFTAFVFIVTLWPLWLQVRMVKGWRFRHPRKIKFN